MSVGRFHFESGQATVEAVAGVAALILAGLLCFQLLAVGYTTTVVDGAAAAGALSYVRGESVDSAVRRALPGWAKNRVRVSKSGPEVRVTVRPPSILPSLAEKLSVSARAFGES